jgi:hypothetical protein
MSNEQTHLLLFTISFFKQNVSLLFYLTAIPHCLETEFFCNLLADCELSHCTTWSQWFSSFRTDHESTSDFQLFSIVKLL